MDENPYEVLGLASGAPPEAVKAAYRTLAFRFHPDHNPGDRAAEDSFKRVDRAYTFLSDPGRKAEYDRVFAAPAAEPAPEPAPSEAEPASPPWEPNAEPPFEVPASDSWRLARCALDILLILGGVAIIAGWRATTSGPASEFVAAVFEPRSSTRHQDARIVLMAGFGLAGYGLFRLLVDDAA